MASQGVEESCLSIEDQAIDTELTTSGQADNVAEPLLSPEEIPLANTDRAETQGTGHQQQDQEQQGTSSGPNLLCLPFPKKLWAIVNDTNLQSVTWNISGDSLVIENTLFQTEILHRIGNQRIFRTRNMQSFLRQLNRYGFRKVRSQDSAGNTGQPRVMIYQNANFQRNKPELVTNILRKADVKFPVLKVKRSTPTTRKASGAEPRAKRARLAPTRRSPRLRKTEEANVEPPSEAPIQQGCAGSMSSLPTGGPTGGLTGRPTSGPTRGPTGGPTGGSARRRSLVRRARRGTCGRRLRYRRAHIPRRLTVRSSPRAGQGAGEMPNNSTERPNFESVVSLYNTCYFILRTILNATARNEASSDEEEDS